MAKIPKEDLIQDISTEARIHPEIVELVLSTLTDIAIERILAGETFQLLGLVKITTHDLPKRTVPPSPKVPNAKAQVIENQTQLRSSVSSTLKALARLQRSDFPDKPGLINRDTWRAALKWKKEGRSREKCSVPTEIKLPQSTLPVIAPPPLPIRYSTQENSIEIRNPFLEDDD
jgi:nucleoid DNA-binding protein